jgi:PilZ domain
VERSGWQGACRCFTDGAESWAWSTSPPGHCRRLPAYQSATFLGQPFSLLTENAPMACSHQMAQGPRAEWFQAQALKCIGLALGAKDAWTKWQYVLEAERWLHLAELQADHLVQTGYQGVERRSSSRHLARIAGTILLEGDSVVDCTVRDFSAAGVGLLLPDTVSLPTEFDLTFNHVTQHCITVWRHPERMGLKFKSM